MEMIELVASGARNMPLNLNDMINHQRVHGAYLKRFGGKKKHEKYVITVPLIQRKLREAVIQMHALRLSYFRSDVPMISCIFPLQEGG